MMFADDTKIWARIQKLEDKDSLQYDLDKLVEWSKQWLLAFKPEKCKVMHIGHDLPTKYTMNTEARQGNTAPRYNYREGSRNLDH